MTRGDVKVIGTIFQVFFFVNRENYSFLHISWWKSLFKFVPGMPFVPEVLLFFKLWIPLLDEMVGYIFAIIERQRIWIFLFEIFKFLVFVKFLFATQIIKKWCLKNTQYTQFKKWKLLPIQSVSCQFHTSSHYKTTSNVSRTCKNVLIRINIYILNHLRTLPQISSRATNGPQKKKCCG